MPIILDTITISNQDLEHTTYISLDYILAFLKQLKLTALKKKSDKVSDISLRWSIEASKPMELNYLGSWKVLIMPMRADF